MFRKLLYSAAYFSISSRNLRAIFPSFDFHGMLDHGGT